METPEGWNPMETAPKDRPILVLHCHEADPYHLGSGAGPDHLTPYGSHVEALSHSEDGPYVAAWGGDDSEWCEWKQMTLEWPAWWFINDGDWESPLSPIGWLPIPGFTKAQHEKCKGCGAQGFHQSNRKPYACDFCDNPDAD